MRTLAIIQARMGSTRLPGKIMMPMAGVPMLKHVINRVAISCVNEYVVAMPIKDMTVPPHHYSVRYIDGDENDVATRFARVFERMDCDLFVRICADSPLIDPALINAAIGLAMATGASLVSNPTYPSGMQVEVVNTNYFLEREKRIPAECREHVLPWLYTKARIGEWITFGVPPNNCIIENVKLSVDTQKDFDRVEKIIKRIGNNPRVGWRECLHHARQA